MQHKIFIVLTIMLMLLTACNQVDGNTIKGSGNVITESREVSALTASIYPAPVIYS